MLLRQWYRNELNIHVWHYLLIVHINFYTTNLKHDMESSIIWLSLTICEVCLVTSLCCLYKVSFCTFSLHHARSVDVTTRVKDLLNLDRFKLFRTVFWLWKFSRYNFINFIQINFSPGTKWGCWESVKSCRNLFFEDYVLFSKLSIDHDNYYFLSHMGIVPLFMLFPSHLSECIITLFLLIKLIIYIRTFSQILSPSYYYN